MHYWLFNTLTFPLFSKREATTNSLTDKESSFWVLPAIDLERFFSSFALYHFFCLTSLREKKLCVGANEMKEYRRGSVLLYWPCLRLLLLLVGSFLEEKMQLPFLSSLQSPAENENSSKNRRRKVNTRAMSFLQNT